MPHASECALKDSTTHKQKQQKGIVTYLVTLSDVTRLITWNAFWRYTFYNVVAVVVVDVDIVAAVVLLQWMNDLRLLVKLMFIIANKACLKCLYIEDEIDVYVINESNSNVCAR